jgi:hypothetical protein
MQIQVSIRCAGSRLIGRLAGLKAAAAHDNVAWRTRLLKFADDRRKPLRALFDIGETQICGVDIVAIEKIGGAAHEGGNDFDSWHELSPVRVAATARRSRSKRRIIVSEFAGRPPIDGRPSRPRDDGALYPAIHGDRLCRETGGRRTRPGHVVRPEYAMPHLRPRRCLVRFIA